MRKDIFESNFFLHTLIKDNRILYNDSRYIHNAEIHSNQLRYKSKLQNSKFFK